MGNTKRRKCKVGSDEFNSKYAWNWVLDPLDGTKDFIQGTGEYAMHLSLNFMQKPYLGVVLIPEKDELWISNGENVWCEKKNRLISKPQFFRKNSLREMVLVTSKNHCNENLECLIEKLHFNKVKIMGSIGCKIASIVRGDSDIYICLSLPGKSSPKDWDFSAPEAILRGAGGSITNIDNHALSYGKKNYEQSGIIIASNNKLLHKSLCSEIKQIIKKYKLYPFDS